MPSYSRVIKENTESQKANFSGLNLPEFVKPGSRPEMHEISLSIFPEFSQKQPALEENLAVANSTFPLEPVARHFVHSAVLRSGQMQSSVNGWFAPVLQGNISHHVKAITSCKY